MVPIDVAYGHVPVPYLIGGGSAAVPGVPAGLAEVHRRWGVLPWRELVTPAAGLARDGVTVPAAHGLVLKDVAPALVLADGAAVYAPNGRPVDGGDGCSTPAWTSHCRRWRRRAPRSSTPVGSARSFADSARTNGGAICPQDLVSYEVIETPMRHSRLAGRTVIGREDLNGLLATIASLPTDLVNLSRRERTQRMVQSLVRTQPETLGETTNISVVDAAGNACVITTSLGIGSGVWLPGLSVHLNSMLGEVELGTTVLPPGTRMRSMMCPLVVVDDDGRLELAVGAAGASRIRSALLQTLTGVLVDGNDPREAVAAPRFHVVAGPADDAVPGGARGAGLPSDGFDAIVSTGFDVWAWTYRSAYFGGVSAVGAAGAGGDPRRDGVGVTLVGADTAGGNAGAFGAAGAPDKINESTRR
jgi:gamma-glutamyltranspeptidase/glutathione hydrolase